MPSKRRPPKTHATHAARAPKVPRSRSRSGPPWRQKDGAGGAPRNVCGEQKNFSLSLSLSLDGWGFGLSISPRNVETSKIQLLANALHPTLSAVPWYRSLRFEGLGLGALPLAEVVGMWLLAWKCRGACSEKLRALIGLCSVESSVYTNVDELQGYPRRRCHDNP